MIRVTGETSKIYKGLALFLGLLGVVFYPIVINPFFNPEPYREVQTQARRNIKREDIQPGNMNIWRNPFLKDLNQEKDKQAK